MHLPLENLAPPILYQGHDEGGATAVYKARRASSATTASIKLVQVSRSL